MSYNSTQSSLSLPADTCIGRHGIIESIVTLVTDEEPAVVNLVGPRWIGKTSVLRCLNPDTTPALNELPYVYVDLSRNPDPNDPLSLIAHNLAESLQSRHLTRGAAQTWVEKPPEKWLRQLGNLATANHVRPLICIDHLDKFLAGSHRSVDWGAVLSMLAGFASLVLASERTLTDISPELSTSPFVHRTIVMTLGLLEEADADRLLASFNAGLGTELTASDRANLIRMVGRHPYILIRAGRQAAVLRQESAERQRKGISTNDIRARIEPVLRPLFEAFWREYGDLLRRYQESLTPAGLPANGAARPEAEYEKIAARAVRQELQRAALIYEKRDNENEFNYFSPLFESFVYQKVALSPPPAAPSDKPLSPADMLTLLDIREGTKEAELLRLLVDNAGQVVKDAQLQEAVWPGTAAERAIVTTVDRLRSKLQQCEGQINGRIVRIRATGYSFQWQS